MTDAAIVALVVGVLTVMGWIIKNVFNAISANTIRIAQLEVKMDDVEKSFTRIELIVSKLSEAVQTLDRTVHEFKASVQTLDKRRRSSDRDSDLE